MSAGDASPQANAEEGRTATVVRYPNRRFYDRSQARYVTLQEIEAMVREGKTVTILDHKTGEDLTGTVLTQLILERYPERMALFPVPVLHLIIRANTIVLGFLREYFQQSLKYLDFWQRFGAFNPMGGPVEWMRTLLPGAPPPASPAPNQPPADVLAARIAELERRLSELDKPRGKTRKKKP